MDKIKLRKTAIIARQILLYFIDFNRAILPIFDKANFYRIPFKYYDNFRMDDKDNFRKSIYRLKRAKAIKKYSDGKETYIELTEKGKSYLKSYFTEQMELKRPKKWDKKWRIIIFDIPNENKKERDILRNKLERLGFLKLQESVYIHPFECVNEIEILKNIYFLKPYVQYILADIVETEISFIKHFYDKKILSDKLM